jgi:hypothetical protein
MTNASVHDQAVARVQAAEDLQVAIAALGAAYRAYQRATDALQQRAGEDLARYLEVPIILHLAQAGFASFLDRKLTGTPYPLGDLVENQHRRIPRIGRGRV